ncbi:hypothetical protein BGX27_007191 [Mortierella sp. AM989]|nr:hypothetical protein BGX27_007191 [Mortierella sp. AM989]
MAKAQTQYSPRTKSKQCQRHQSDPAKILAILLVSLSFLSTISASITCALPAGASYEAGDSVILDWGSDGTSPVVSDITSINGTLYCNGNNAKIADVSIPNLTGPYNWTVPSVGNATTVGGTVGTCPQNAFHIEYAGEAAGFLGIVKIPWGPVRCGTITINPEPNGTITTTTTTMSSTTTSSSSTSAPTTPIDNSNESGLSMTAIVIIAVVAAVLGTLAVVGIVVCLRKKRRQRKLDDALMPWDSSTASRFSKVSSMDEEPGSGGAGIASTAAGAGIGAGARVSYEMKPQPTLPQPDRGTYYTDDGDYSSYGHYQQQQQLLQHQHDYRNQGYEGDSYYNPYYASGVPSVTGVINQSNPSFYDMNNSSTPGNCVRPPFAQGGEFNQQQHTSGYFPPPPPGPLNSSPLSYGRAPAGTGAGLTSSETLPSALTSLPTISSATSSPKRAPQTVMQEMGRKETEEEETKQEAIPPNSPTTKVEVM